jgi:ABC-type multidrug transport system fused ATPase/permease subunit
MNSSRKGYRGFLVEYLRPQSRRVALLALLLLGGIGLQLANPQILKSFIDTAVAGGEQGTLFGVALLFLGVALLGQLVSVAETYIAENIGLTATNRLRGALALHCLRLDPSFHNTHSPGELIERVDGDVATLGSFFSRFVIHMLGNAILLVGILALLLVAARSMQSGSFTVGDFALFVSYLGWYPGGPARGAGQAGTGRSVGPQATIARVLGQHITINDAAMNPRPHDWYDYHGDIELTLVKQVPDQIFGP